MNKEDGVSWLVGAKNAFDDGMKDGMNNKPKKNGEEVGIFIPKFKGSKL